MAAIQLQALKDQWKIFLRDDKILRHEPKTPRTIFPIGLLGETQAFLTG
jgi:hypothetical protein